MYFCGRFSIPESVLSIAIGDIVSTKINHAHAQLACKNPEKPYVLHNFLNVALDSHKSR